MFFLYTTPHFTSPPVHFFPRFLSRPLSICTSSSSISLLFYSSNVYSFFLSVSFYSKSDPKDIQTVWRVFMFPPNPSSHHYRCFRHIGFGCFLTNLFLRGYFIALLNKYDVTICRINRNQRISRYIFRVSPTTVSRFKLDITFFSTISRCSQKDMSFVPLYI